MKAFLILASGVLYSAALVVSALLGAAIAQYDWSAWWSLHGVDVLVVLHFVGIN